MPFLPLTLWLPLSIAAGVVLVVASMLWVLRAARRTDPASRDGRSARRMSLLFAVGALVWLAYALYTGYGALWQAQPWVMLAQQPALLRLPLIVGAIPWVAALLLTRVMRMVAKAGAL